VHTVALESRERELLEGAEGPAMQLAMRVLVRTAEINGAERFVDVSFAHISACFYNGAAHVDFAQYLVDNGAYLSVPTWTNTGLVSQVDDQLRTGDLETVQEALRLMRLYEQLGCRAVWTCAPYQLPQRPAFGDHIVGSESNAVTFYNSVVGACTNKYGDFVDVCAALVGKVPYSGLHRTSERRGQVLFNLHRLPPSLLDEDMFFHVLGHVIGRRVGSAIPVVDGLSTTTNEDQLKALGTAMASSGSVNLFHAVGITPEAPTLDAAFQGGEPELITEVAPHDLITARDELTSANNGPVDMVALGTPHFSLTEFQKLAPLLDGRHVSSHTVFYVSTSRHVRGQAAARGLTQALERAGVKIIVDTCTYFSPAVRGCRGRAMTDSAKWAYYAPGLLPVDVVFGSMKECVETAVRGKVWRDETLWRADTWGAVV